MIGGLAVFRYINMILPIYHHILPSVISVPILFANKSDFAICSVKNGLS